MDFSAELKSKSKEDLEQWFVEGLETSPVPAANMQRALAYLKGTGHDEQAIEWAELLQEALQTPEQAADALNLLDLRYTWTGETKAFRTVARKALSTVLPGRPGVAVIESAGLTDEKIKIGDSLARVRKLTSLAPGALCEDKTWGFGTVSRLDHFYRKVTIDFDSRAGHEMSFEYAAQTLKLLADDHLMVRLHREPEAIAAMVTSDAGELVKVTIQSYGPLSAPLLKERLVPELLPESDWKRFWDAARRALKADPLVDLPAKRNDPIQLLASEKTYDESWFKTFGRERDIKDLIHAIGEFERETGPRELNDTEKDILRDRLAFCIRGSQWRQPERVAWFLMVAKRYGFDFLAEGEVSGKPWRVDVTGTTAELLTAERCAIALSDLPARDVEAFIAFVGEADADQGPGLLMGVMPLLPLSPLNAVLTMLIKKAPDMCADYLRQRLHDREAGAPLVYWICTHLDRAEAWTLINMLDLATLAIDTLGAPAAGDNLKARNQLEILFESRDWLQAVFDKVDPVGRRDCLRKVQNTRGIDASQRRSIMARVIKIYPELEQALASEPAEPRATVRQHLTSWRSYNQRREQLKALIETLIPQNSKEIAVARSYGDLSENHEYKAAKEHQGILLRRRGEMEQDLKLVRGTDFAGFPSDKVGMGVCVELERPDGLRQTYCILGEWDRDEDLNIISSNSRLSTLLEGKSAGDMVNLPALQGTGQDEETCKIIAVAAPGADVKTWVESTGEG
jgi:transcription elongation GreA/GreB family factor